MSPPWSNYCSRQQINISRVVFRKSASQSLQVHRSLARYRPRSICEWARLAVFLRDDARLNICSLSSDLTKTNINLAQVYKRLQCRRPLSRPFRRFCLVLSVGRWSATRDRCRDRRRHLVIKATQLMVWLQNNMATITERTRRRNAIVFNWPRGPVADNGDVARPSRRRCALPPDRVNEAKQRTQRSCAFIATPDTCAYAVLSPARARAPSPSGHADYKKIITLFLMWQGTAAKRFDSVPRAYSLARKTTLDRVPDSFVIWYYQLRTEACDKVRHFAWFVKIIVMARSTR